MQIFPISYPSGITFIIYIDAIRYLCPQPIHSISHVLVHSWLFTGFDCLMTVLLYWFGYAAKNSTLWLVPCKLLPGTVYNVVCRRQFSTLPRCVVSYKKENIVVIYQKRRKGNLSHQTPNTSAYARWKSWPAKMLICSSTIRPAITELQRMYAEASVLLPM